MDRLGDGLAGAASIQRPNAEPAVAPLQLHHIGILVSDIAESTGIYVNRFGYEVRSPIIHDPEQTARVRFLALCGSPVFIELVTPDGPHSKLSRALSRGGGLNHVCYAVDDIDAACRRLREQEMLLVQPPVSAVAFPGRKIAWLIGNDRIPVELVDAGAADEI